MGETPEEQAIVLRCQAAVIRAFVGARDEDFVQLAADLSRLPADHPDRAPTAGAAILVLHQHGALVTTGRADHLAVLLSMADVQPPSHPQWEQARSFLRTRVLLTAAMDGQMVDMDTVEAELAPMLEKLGDISGGQPLRETMDMMMQLTRAFEEGDESVLHQMPAELGRHLELVGDDPKLAPLVSSMNFMTQAMAAVRRGEFGEVLENIELLRDWTQEKFDPGHPIRDSADELLARMKPMLQLVDGAGAGQGGVPSTEPVAELEELTNQPGGTDNDRAMNHIALGNALLRGGAETDLARVEAGVRSFREALRLLTPEDRRYAFAMHSVALGLYRASELAGTVDGLDEAAELAEQARELLGGPQHQQWALASELLATIRHRKGNLHEAGKLGLDAQRGYLWRALLESEVAGAKIAIRNAEGVAVATARRCLQSDDVAGAVHGLDMGRGLMLFAATEWHRVPARLSAAGRDDLARRWEGRGKGAKQLRREALAVLAQLPDIVDSVLAPPSLDEIRSALATLDADALVYLVAAEPPDPGLVVIVTVDLQLAWMALPELVVRAEDDVERYLAALAGRSRDRDLAPPPEDVDGFTDSLDALCDWAWQAAMGPLLDRFFAHRPPRPDGRVPRIVLVPMGDLARIPWQAARRGDGVRAIELAAFSQAVSARLMCENAARAQVSLSSTGLVVGDPDTGDEARTLEDARLEAHAVRQVFYRGARYVGRRPNGTVSPSGRGTAAEVRRWLTDTGPAAGVMLHLACHGSFVTGLDDAKSFLVLAPEDDGAGELSAEEIIDLLAAAPGRQVGLVVLAACNTGRSVHGYDEAYSLGTAFLAGSACSVLSTQWSIPDAQTPSLMYLFHHYCRREGLPPWQALRQAQMWMLDPKREAPHGMPAELWQAMPAGEPAPVVAWAGFVHYGH